jgi:hypothetical protein
MSDLVSPFHGVDPHAVDTPLCLNNSRPSHILVPSLACLCLNFLLFMRCHPNYEFSTFRNPFLNRLRAASGLSLLSQRRWRPSTDK